MQFFLEKKYKKNECRSTCNLNLIVNDDEITYSGEFFNEYNGSSSFLKSIFVTHIITINRKNGDFIISMSRKTNLNVRSSQSKEFTRVKKNNFLNLFDLSESGFYRGEMTSLFWGVKFRNTIDQFFDVFKQELKKDITCSFLENKEYTTPVVNGLYDLITDFHLSKKNIKGHDMVYRDIWHVYPKKKWLKLNDNKFLPAVLDEKGIKSKYLIKELSSLKIEDDNIDINTVRFLCSFFGYNYVDHLKKLNWKIICKYRICTKKSFGAKNEIEKHKLINMINDSNVNTINLAYHPALLVHQEQYVMPIIFEFLNIRNFLENKGYTGIKIKGKTIDDLSNLTNRWLLTKEYLTVGHKWRYEIPENIKSEIESPIIIDNNVYIPKLLLSQDDYTIEGYKMKNCMSRHFMHGSIFLFVSLSYGKKTINLQYQKGNLIQSYGKSNSCVPQEIFGDAMKILTNRMKKHNNLTWTKEKYDILP